MGWMLVAGAVWVAGACVLALLIGRSVRLADRIESASGPAPLRNSAPAG